MRIEITKEEFETLYTNCLRKQYNCERCMYHAICQLIFEITGQLPKDYNKDTMHDTTFRTTITHEVIND